MVASETFRAAHEVHPGAPRPPAIPWAPKLDRAAFRVSLHVLGTWTPGLIYIGRGDKRRRLPPSPLQSPFKFSSSLTRAQAINALRDHFNSPSLLQRAVPSLLGHGLV